MLGVGRIDRRKVVRDFIIDDDEDLDAFLRLLLQQPIKSPSSVLSWRPAKIQLGTEPPVVNVYLLFS